MVMIFHSDTIDDASSSISVSIGGGEILFQIGRKFSRYNHDDRVSLRR